RPDWNEIAEKGMPLELRFVYEFIVFFDARDARAELRKNANRVNHFFIYAFQVDFYNSEGNTLLMMRFFFMSGCSSTASTRTTYHNTFSTCTTRRATKTPSARARNP